jgi:hypothetical protein
MAVMGGEELGVGVGVASHTGHRFVMSSRTPFKGFAPRARDSVMALKMRKLNDSERLI